MIETTQQIEGQMVQLIEQYGEWAYDIPLTNDIWTRGNEGLPHTRLKRVLQIARDPSASPLHSRRVEDLGCLEGQFAIEFAQTGAEVIQEDLLEKRCRLRARVLNG